MHDDHCLFFLVIKSFQFVVMNQRCIDYPCDAAVCPRDSLDCTGQHVGIRRA